MSPQAAAQAQYYRGQSAVISVPHPLLSLSLSLSLGRRLNGFWGLSLNNSVLFLGISLVNTVSVG